MINIIGMILAIFISSLWIFLPLKRVPESIRLKKSKYVVSIITGATICTLLIIILETIWDRITGIPVKNVTTLAQAVTVSFLRAALLEEGAKYIFVKRALKKNQPQGRLQYMLLAGTIGVGYSITEKLVMASAAFMFADAVFCLHAMFEFIMGWYLYEASIAVEEGKKRLCSIKAFAVPFVLHGIWDSMLFATDVYLTADGMSLAAVISLLLLLAGAVFAIIGEVRMVKPHTTEVACFP